MASAGHGSAARAVLRRHAALLPRTSAADRPSSEGPSAWRSRAVRGSKLTGRTRTASPSSWAGASAARPGPNRGAGRHQRVRAAPYVSAARTGHPEARSSNALYCPDTPPCVRLEQLEVTLRAEPPGPLAGVQGPPPDRVLEPPLGGRRELARGRPRLPLPVGETAAGAARWNPEVRDQHGGRRDPVGGRRAEQLCLHARQVHPRPLAGTARRPRQPPRRPLDLGRKVVRLADRGGPVRESVGHPNAGSATGRRCRACRRRPSGVRRGRAGRDDSDSPSQQPGPRRPRRVEASGAEDRVARGVDVAARPATPTA